MGGASRRGVPAGARGTAARWHGDGGWEERGGEGRAGGVGDAESWV